MIVYRPQHQNFDNRQIPPMELCNGKAPADMQALNLSRSPRIRPHRLKLASQRTTYPSLNPGAQAAEPVTSCTLHEPTFDLHDTSCNHKPIQDTPVSRSSLARTCSTSRLAAAIKRTMPIAAYQRCCHS